MSDDDNFMESDSDSGQDLEVGRKVGFLPAVAIKILKWAALGIAAVIFIVTVVVITVSIMNKGQAQTGYPAASQAYRGTIPILSYFNIPEIRGRTSDVNPTTFIVQVSLGYDLNDKAVQSELVARAPQLQDIVRSFFAERTADQLAADHEEQLKAELKEEINRIMTSGKIQEVLFLEFNVVPL